MLRPTKKVRIDQLLLRKGFASSRTKARTMVMAKTIYIGGRCIIKPGILVSPNSKIQAKKTEYSWVSRGGEKLFHALNYFSFIPSGKVCLDIGASKGGFTDVLLHFNSKKVYSIDVGHRQIDEKIRKDKRVISLEKTNSRYLTKKDIPDPIDFIVCDVSFISIRKAIPAALELASPKAKLICLIKPQFELTKREIGKKGVIRDPVLHKKVCFEVTQWINSLEGWSTVGLIPSPILGSKGNKEFLLAAEYYK